MILREIKYALLISALIIGMMCPGQSFAQGPEDVDISRRNDGWEINVALVAPMRLMSFLPKLSGDLLIIHLTPLNFRDLPTEDVEALRRAMSLAWNRSIGIPLKKITFDGSAPEFPQMVLQFSEPLYFVVKSSPDFRTLHIYVKTSANEEQGTSFSDPLSDATGTIAANARNSFEMEKALDTEITKSSALAEARKSLLERQYDQAIEIYRNVLRSAETKEHPEALELLGYALQSRGRLEEAKARYELYLKEFPQSAGVQRVQQRLAGLVTMGEELKEPLKVIQPRSKMEQKQLGLNKKTQFFGDLSQSFFRDQTYLNGSGQQVNRSDLSTYLNLDLRRQGDQSESRTKFAGSYRNDFRAHTKDEDRVSSLFWQAQGLTSQWFGRIGRQNMASSGGVLGRFDGIYLANNVTPEIKVNAVAGLPVDTTTQGVEFDRKFYSLSADFTIGELFNVTPYFVDQYNHGVTDRRAIGSEVHYFDRQKSFLNLIDYDLFYKQLNIFLLNGSYTTEGRTTYTFILDYRKSPFLTTNNALLGQATTKFSDLLDQLSNKEVYDLAKDRTSLSKSTTLSITQELANDLHVTGEISMSQLEGTVTSGGVSGFESAGWDFSYMGQVVASNVFKESNVLVSRIQFSDRSTDNLYSLSFDDRFPLNRRLLLSTRFQADYSDKKGVSGYRRSVRPSMRLEYSFNTWLRFDFEGGTEWFYDIADDVTQESTGLFLNTGYRLSF